MISSAGDVRFNASAWIVATWRFVRLASWSYSLGCIYRNSFQAILACGEGTNCYVAFHYGSLYDRPSTVGLRGASGAISLGFNPATTTLSSGSNVGVPGRWVCVHWLSGCMWMAIVLAEGTGSIRVG